ncbi:hypothetical protein ACJX0J_012877, partial [Zea mays]
FSQLVIDITIQQAHMISWDLHGESQSEAISESYRTHGRHKYAIIIFLIYSFH